MSQPPTGAAADTNGPLDVIHPTTSVSVAAPPAISYPPISAGALAAGKVTIVGFGSLLSARSAASTFGSSLSDFRLGLIKDFRRIFAHVAPIFIERGIANVDTKEMSSLSVEPCPGATLLVSLFEIPLSGLPAFFAREMEFRWLHVPVYDPSGTRVDPGAVDGQGLVCAAYSDEEYRSVRLGGSDDAFHEAFGRWGVQRVWRNDLLPCPVYLRHVVLAAAGMDHAFHTTHDNGKGEQWGDATAITAAATDAGSDTPSGALVGLHVSDRFVSLPSGRVLDSFLDCTFLGDRVTSVRAYLRDRPHLMLLQPPSSLVNRYSG